MQELGKGFLAEWLSFGPSINTRQLVACTVYSMCTQHGDCSMETARINFSIYILTFIGTYKEKETARILVCEGWCIYPCGKRCEENILLNRLWMKKHVSFWHKPRKWIFIEGFMVFIMDYYRQYQWSIISKRHVIKIALGFQFKVSDGKTQFRLPENV